MLYMYSLIMNRIVKKKCRKIYTVTTGVLRSEQCYKCHKKRQWKDEKISICAFACSKGNQSSKTRIKTG